MLIVRLNSKDMRYQHQNLFVRSTLNPERLKLIITAYASSETIRLRIEWGQEMNSYFS